MKLTNKQIRQIIKEELNKILNENISPEKMNFLADMFLSEDEANFRQALLLLESIEVFQHVKLEDRTTEFHDDIKHFEKYKDIKREDYRWTILATPEFYNAAAEALGEVGRFGPNIVFNKAYIDGIYRWTFHFFRGREPGDMAQLGVKKQVRPDY